MLGVARARVCVCVCVFACAVCAGRAGPAGGGVDGYAPTSNDGASTLPD